MVVSQTKREIIQNRSHNPFLHASALQPVQEAELDLSTDHPNFPPEESILDGAIKALEAGETHYVDVPGVPGLRETVAQFLGESGLNQFTRDTVQVTAGMQECRFLTIQHIGDQQPSIAVPEVVHPGVLKAIGVRPLEVIILPVDTRRMLPVIEGIKSALDGGCRMVFLESPSRLTGAVYTSEEVRQIVELVKDYAADLLWDQGMAPWVQDDYLSPASIPGYQDQVTIMGELWPGTGLERLYLGFIAGPEKWMKVLKTQKQVLSICTNAQIQFAALEAKPVFNEQHGSRLKLLAQNHHHAKALLKTLGMETLQGEAVNILAFCARQDTLKKILEAGYRVVDGKDFGAEGILRISITPQGTEVSALKSLNI